MIELSTVERPKRAYDAFLRECATAQVLDRIGHRWTAIALCTIAENGPQPMRYSDVARQIPGLSKKVLTQTLRALQRDGFVERTVTPAVPIQVSYHLTELGRSLYGMLQQVQAWADDHIDEIHEARTRTEPAQTA